MNYTYTCPNCQEEYTIGVIITKGGAVDIEHIPYRCSKCLELTDFDVVEQDIYEAAEQYIKNDGYND